MHYRRVGRVRAGKRSTVRRGKDGGEKVPELVGVVSAAKESRLERCGVLPDLFGCRGKGGVSGLVSLGDEVTEDSCP